MLVTRSTDLVAVLACLLIVGVPLGVRAEEAGVADRGGDLYQGTCGTCHGRRGEHEALGLSRRIVELAQAEIVEALTRYRDTGDFAVMPIPIKSTLSDADIRALATYIAGFAEPDPQ